MKHLRFFICLACLLYVSTPLFAQDYLTLYFKDGHKERHLLSLVENIKASKIDNDGTFHSDYQVQQIFMKDTIYSYPLAEIDSMSFKAVTEEQIVQSIQTALPTVVDIFQGSASSEEMGEQIAKLQTLEGVEDISVGTSSVTVQIKDWRCITFYFPTEPSFFDNQKKTAVRSENRGNRSLLSDYAPKVNNSVKVVIANQMHNNMSDYRQWQIDGLMQPIYQEFLSLGFDAVYDDDPDSDFFENRMFDNDIVLLDTHGSYDNNLHWVTTSDEVTFKELFMDLPYDYNEKEFACIEEIRSGKSTAVFYYSVSEQFIDKQDHSFHNAIPPIFFNVACHSMDGDDDIQQFATDIWVKGNAGMANVFQKKGIDTYYGYSKSNVYGQQTGADILHAMLMGCSEEKAISLLRSVQKFENHILDPDNLKDAYLLDWLSPYTSRGQFIVKTFTTATSDEQAFADYARSGLVNLIGITTKLRNSLVETELVAEPTIVAGFRYGNDKSLATCNNVSDLEFVPVETDLGNYCFSASIPAKLGETVYYQAYTYDGIHYNLGEICSFTVEKPEDTREYVDLGLPSGTLWATCNVGASAPEENGDYFAWGETTGFFGGKTLFNSENYCYYNNPEEMLTKYCNNSGYGFVDNLTTLTPEDDVATANWGDEWRMPTREEILELASCCNTDWIDKDISTGFMFTGPSGKYIYLPSAGYRTDDNLYNNGVLCSYWTSSLCTDNPNDAWSYTFGGVPNRPEVDRWYGLTVRPVYSEKKKYTGTIAIEESELTFTSGSVMRELNLTSDCEWKATVNQGSDWLTVSPAQGVGNARIAIQATTNISGSPRSGVITISSEYSQPVTITVNQDCEYVFATRTVDGHTYTIKWYYDKEDKRINGDGSVFYATWFNICKDGEECRLAEKYYIYTDNPDDRTWAGASAAVDIANDIIYFYTFSKDASGSYTMSGNLYEITPSRTQVYSLFTGKNWGWHSYFAYSDNQLVLNAFSFSGYYRLRATKSGSEWSMKQGSYIKPDNFRAERLENETILVFEGNEQSGTEYEQVVYDKACLNFSTYGYRINTLGYLENNFDFEKAAEQLGISDISQAKCYIINPDGSCTTSSTLSYLYYDANGHACNKSNYAIFFKYNNSSFFVFQDANLLEVGKKYSFRFAATYNNKTVIFVYNLEIVPDDTKFDYGGCPDDNHPHVIDLGGGVCWSCCNLGATWPGDHGDYYAWGETQPKNDFLFENYAFYKNISYQSTGNDTYEVSGISSKYNTQSGHGPTDNILVLQPEDDPAYLYHGNAGEWRMPTDDECQKLLTFDHYLAMSHGILGYVFNSSNGYIFMPLGGYKEESGHMSRGERGLFWASTYPTDSSFEGDCIRLLTDDVEVTDFLRHQGFNIRPVYNGDNGAHSHASANSRKAALSAPRPVEVDVLPEFLRKEKKIKAAHDPARMLKLSSDNK